MSSDTTEIHTTKKLTPYSRSYYQIEGLTVHRIFRECVAKYSNNDFLGFRQPIPGSKKKGPYIFMKYKQVGEIVTCFASGLKKLGLEPNDKVGIFMKNCPEWSVTDYSCASQSLVSVPVYDSYQAAECQFIIIHSDMKAIVLTQDKLEFVKEIKSSGKAPLLEHVIVVDDPLNPDAPRPEGASYKFSEVVALGKANPVEDQPPTPDSIFTIVYTSGTTGTPKGAIISHRNASASAVQLMSRATPPKDGEQDYLISYLPLAHIFARILEITILQFGCGIGFFSGTMTTISDDIATLRPTILPGVPRVFSKTYAKIHSQIEAANFMKRWAFNVAFNSKLKTLKAGFPHEKAALSDYLVFNQIKEKMGGRVRLIYNGAASLPVNISEFISTCMGCIIAEGYGLTETTACVTCGQITAFDNGSIGVPYQFSEVRLKSIPEMDYYVTDKPYPRGEILVRGPQIFQGYYKDEEGTKEAFDEDGFFKTGDVGMWVPGPYLDDDGKKQPSLKIIDRRKNIFKLSQGEFICAERLEEVFVEKNEYTRQIMLYGPSTASALVAFVVPEWDLLLSEEKKEETGSDSWADGAVKRWREGKAGAGKQEPTVSTADSDAKSASASSTSSSSSSSEASGSSDTFHCQLSLRQALQHDPAVMSFLLKELKKTSEANPDRVRRFEIPKGIVLCEDEWTDTNKCLTASFKMKREFIRNKYKEDFLTQLKVIEEGAEKASAHSSSSSSSSSS